MFTAWQYASEKNDSVAMKALKRRVMNGSGGAEMISAFVNKLIWQNDFINGERTMEKCTNDLLLTFMSLGRL